MKFNPREIACERCGASIIALRSTRKLCEDCVKENNRKLCREGARRRYQENPDHIKDIQKKYYDGHREQRIKGVVEYGKAHPGWRNEKYKEFLAAHPGYKKEHDAKYYQEHKEQAIASNKAWIQANYERHRANCRARLVRYRARLAGASGEWTVEQFDALCEMAEYKCFYCEKHMENPTVDHMTPLSRGGSNDIENIVPACGSCNYSKRNKTADEFIAWLAKKKAS